MKKIFKLLTAALVLTSVNASAQVFVNGQLYQGAALAQLQQQYGDVIPSGNYWLIQNGNWGYVDSNQVQGNFYTDNQGTANSGRFLYPESDSVESDWSNFCARNGCSILW